MSMTGTSAAGEGWPKERPKHFSAVLSLERRFAWRLDMSPAEESPRVVDLPFRFETCQGGFARRFDPSAEAEWSPIFGGRMLNATKLLIVGRMYLYVEAGAP